MFLGAVVVHTGLDECLSIVNYQSATFEVDEQVVGHEEVCSEDEFVDFGNPELLDIVFSASKVEVKSALAGRLDVPAVRADKRF